MENVENERSKKMPDLKVTENEWRDELDKLRPERVGFNEEQDEYLLYARNHERPVSFLNIAKIWERRGWGKIGQEALRRRYLGIRSDD